MSLINYYAAPLPVVGCPNGCEMPVMVTGYVATEPEDIQIGPRTYTRNAAELVGWYLSCGCFVGSKRFTLRFVSPDLLPRFVRNEQ